MIKNSFSPCYWIQAGNTAKARANGLNNFSIATEAGQKATGLQKPKPTPPENSR
ncbi:MAG: hypothetical protein ACOYM3_26025 [Terrimicrobiaceae bacterium]